MEEIPLTGGRVTDGVVRIGDTVRRPAGVHSLFVRALLQHLENVGFEAAPRFLGVDAQGRDTFSFLPGHVPSDIDWWEDPQLAAAAALIRRFHDATAGTGMAGDAEVVCHNDLSPCNFVFVDATPRAIIDFDAARPGSGSSTLAMLPGCGWISATMTITAKEQLRRLSLFADAYRCPAGPALVRSIMLRQRLLRDEGNARGHAEMAAWAAHSLAWTRAALR